MRRLAARYAARLPCWSTWSAQTFVMQAICGLAEQTARWFEVSSATHQAGGRASRTRSSRPAVGQAFSAGASLEASVSIPLARSMASARRLVVVLPALPVTPSTGTGEKRRSRSAAPDAPASPPSASGAQGESRRTSPGMPRRCAMVRSRASSSASPGGIAALMPAARRARRGAARAVVSGSPRRGARPRAGTRPSAPARPPPRASSPRPRGLSTPPRRRAR